MKASHEQSVGRVSRRGTVCLPLVDLCNISCFLFEVLVLFVGGFGLGSDTNGTAPQGLYGEIKDRILPILFCCFPLLLSILRRYLSICGGYTEPEWEKEPRGFFVHYGHLSIDSDSCIASCQDRGKKQGLESSISTWDVPTDLFPLTLGGFPSEQAIATGLFLLTGTSRHCFVLLSEYSDVCLCARVSGLPAVALTTDPLRTCGMLFMLLPLSF